MWGRNDGSDLIASKKGTCMCSKYPLRVLTVGSPNPNVDNNVLLASFVHSPITKQHLLFLRFA